MFGGILILITLTSTVAVCSDVVNEDVTLGARRNPPHHSSEEELKDMVVVSMQSIVSLNQLVTELTTRLAKNTLAVEDTAQQVKQLRASLTEETAKFNNQIKDVAGQLDELKEDSNVTVATLSDNLSTLSDKLQGLVEQVGTEFGTVEEELTTLRDEVTRKNSAVSIVSAEEGLREANCSKVCAGTTGRDTTAWERLSANGIYITVDMSACGFVAVPTVTTAMEGQHHHWETTGSSEVYRTTATSFKIYIRNTNGRSTTTNADNWNWNIEWVAVGYIC